MTEKIDFKKTLASYHAPRGRFEIVDVPTRLYLMIDGHGDPNASPMYSDALAASGPASTFAGLFEYNLNTLYDALSKP